MANSLITKLPLYLDTSYRYQSILGEKRVSMSFYYNSRSGWYMDIEEQEGTSIVAGLKLLPNVIHGGDFSLAKYGLDGYFKLVPTSPNIRYEEIDPLYISQYYELFYIEAI